MLRRWKSGGAPQPERFGATIEQEEARLIGLIAGGDLQAFDRLYRRYASRLTRFLERITHRSMLIGEIVNDTMLVVWRKANTYDLSSKVSTWIFAIAYRKALKAMKKFDEPFDCDFEQCSGDAMLEPENKMAQKKLQKKLAIALDALSTDQRCVVNYTYYHSMQYEEIGSIMGCPVSTVKTRMFYARRRLRTLLAERQSNRI